MSNNAILVRASPKTLKSHRSSDYHLKVQSPFLETRRQTLVSASSYMHAPETTSHATQAKKGSQSSLLLSPVTLSRDWSSRSSTCASPTPSSIGPSPNTRIRAFVHARDQAKSTPRLSGNAFSLASTIFDSLTSRNSSLPSSDTIHRSVSLMGSQMQIINETGDYDGETTMEVPLSTFVTLVQAVASDLLTLQTTNVNDKIFLTHLLCEVYKLRQDLCFGELVTTLSSANAAVVRVGHNGLNAVGSSPWNCENVMMLLAAAANHK
eukprot:c117_g1_i1.p1 GENE.c117_g1_i1~~c117_g1_i1.p1  ORF type:complete len:265 (-),score=58.56 c117_g1_i1:222-1016(-)